MIHVVFAKGGSTPTVMPMVAGVGGSDYVCWHIHSSDDPKDKGRLKKVKIEFEPGGNFFPEKDAGTNHFMEKKIDYKHGGVAFIYGTSPGGGNGRPYPYKYTVSGETADGKPTDPLDPVIVTDSPPPAQ